MIIRVPPGRRAAPPTGHLAAQVCSGPPPVSEAPRPVPLVPRSVQVAPLVAIRLPSDY